MADTSIDYQAVLADLAGLRAAYNRAIDADPAGIIQILSVGTTGDVTVSLTGVSATGMLGASDHDGFLGMSLLDATKKHLRFVRKKQTNREIADALEAGG